MIDVAAPPTLVKPGPVGEELIASNPNLETTSSSFAVRVFRSSNQFGEIRCRGNDNTYNSHFF